MKTKIFAYRGNLGATTDLKEGKFINDPTTAGQLGCVVATTEVEISKEAKDILRNAKREGGSFAEVMLTRHSPESKIPGSSIGLLGFHKHHFGKEVRIGRVCDTSILDDIPDSEVEAPQDYRDFIDKDNPPED